MCRGFDLEPAGEVSTRLFTDRAVEDQVCSAGILFMLVGGIFLGDILPAFGIYAAQPYSLYIHVLFVGLVAYAICKYRALEITTVIHKTLMWLALSSVAVFLLYAIACGIQFAFRESAQSVRFGIGAVLSFLFMLIHFRWIQPQIDHLFQRRKYDIMQVVEHFARQSVELTELRQLADRVVKTLHEVLYAEHVSFFILDREHLVPVGAGTPGDVSISIEHPFLRYLAKTEHILEYDQVRLDPALQAIGEAAPTYFDQVKAKLVVPLVHHGAMVGAVHLGGKTNLKPYSTLDIEMLSRLRPGMTIGLVNSLLLRRWNEMLEQEVKRKTEELTLRTEELTRLNREMEDLLVERKHAEEQIRQHAAELARSNSELAQFAYVVSHDLQEPLRVIAGYAQLLKRSYLGKLDSDADAFVNFIVQGARRMHALINDLLEYSRLQTRGRPFQPIECATLVEQALINLKTAIEESGATVTYNGLPTVLADGLQLTQIFQNLISNAIKFRSKDAPRIEIAVERRGQEWCFAVHDNGIGLDQQYADRIFIIFQRLHTQQEYPGTGIGLAICKRVVERHGGRIWVESAVGQGATFYFTLPMVPEGTSAPNEGIEDESQGNGVSGE